MLLMNDNIHPYNRPEYERIMAQKMKDKESLNDKSAAVREAARLSVDACNIELERLCKNQPSA